MAETSNQKLKVFLCHASEDKSTVRDLYKRLSAEDWIDPWLDEEKLLPGQDWDLEIKKAVEETDAVIVFLSKNSVSKEGYIQKEIKKILDISDEKPDETIFLMPLRLDGCQPPRRLNKWHYVDFFPTDRKDWAYGRIQKSLEKRAWSLNKKVENVARKNLSFHQERTSSSSVIPNLKHFSGPLGKDVYSEDTLPKDDIPDLGSLMASLDKLIGLQDVKDFVRNLVNRLIADQARRRNGQQVPRTNFHMLFVGNPGTGKTTVARLMGEIFRELGYLKSGHVHEVTTKDLVAGYVGQTAGQTADNIVKALDGILFIDEAYQLRTDQGWQNDFISTAVTTLMKAMEDYSRRLVVIAAGYPNEMSKFRESNPGLSSRFGGGTIEFNDFDDEELIEILRNKITGLGALLTGEAEEKVRGYLLYKRHITDNFGNAGEMDNLFQQMYNTQANRYSLNDGLDTLRTFIASDIPYVPEEFLLS